MLVFELYKLVPIEHAANARIVSFELDTDVEKERHQRIIDLQDKIDRAILVAKKWRGAYRNATDNARRESARTALRRCTTNLTKLTDELEALENETGTN